MYGQTIRIVGMSVAAAWDKGLTPGLFWAFTTRTKTLCSRRWVSCIDSIASSTVSFGYHLGQVQSVIKVIKVILSQQAWEWYDGWSCLWPIINMWMLGGTIAQSVERMTPGEEVGDRIPLWPSAPYWLGRCQYNVTGSDRSHGLSALSRVWQHLKLSHVSLGTRPRYSLVVDEDVMKTNK